MQNRVAVLYFLSSKQSYMFYYQNVTPHYIPEKQKYIIHIMIAFHYQQLYHLQFTRLILLYIVCLTASRGLKYRVPLLCFDFHRCHRHWRIRSKFIDWINWCQQRFVASIIEIKCLQKKVREEYRRLIVYSKSTYSQSQNWLVRLIVLKMKY